MTQLLLQPIEDAVSDEDIAGFLSHYGFPPFAATERIAGTGARPAVLLAFNDLQPEALRILQARIHRVFWNERTVEAVIMTARTE
ncbi:hypothetical protein [Paraburkholderia mimosarum]|uniref:hypothetical protein n=1 Tax=Paraburkholderia mimosarum TaxID=312026 RepID=UPI000411D7E9|nr:hypothetical protein [Paraburkholderia mimosarum]